jgi:PqqD family protein of HPr-rel-A system
MLPFTDDWSAMQDHGRDVETLSGPAQRAGITLERVAGEAILLDHDTGRAHVVNGSAARLWELLAGGRDRAALAAAFGAAYGLPAEAVRDDVEATLQSFAALGLLA